jgi:hypothetical protein
MAKKLLLAACAVAMAGCGGKTPAPVTKIGGCTGPAWACEFTSGACPLPEMKGNLCAVGQDDSKNRIVARRNAETSARGAMERTISLKVTSWNRRVIGTLSSGEAEEFNKTVGMVDSDSIVKQVQAGVVVPKVYDGGEMYYAMAMMDAKTLEAALNGYQKVQQLSEAVRKRVQEVTTDVLADFEKDTLGEAK